MGLRLNLWRGSRTDAMGGRGGIAVERARLRHASDAVPRPHCAIGERIFPRDMVESVRTLG